MKKTWMFVLLLSLGCNLGLGYRLWQSQNPHILSHSETSGKFGPSRPDSLWRDNMIDRRLQHMTKALHLRPGQVVAMKAIQFSGGEKIRARGRRLKELRDGLRDLLLDQPANPKRLRAAMHRMGREQAELDSMVTETVLDELKILDEDQREAYLDMLPMGRRAFQQHRRGHRGGPVR